MNKTWPVLRAALMTGPNLITLSRIGLLALALLGFFLGAVRAAIALGALAGITDYLDGWLARRTGQVTRLGEILDQFCDVVLELTLLTVAVSLAVLPLWVIVLHVLREIWVAAIRRSSIELGTNIPSRRSGKLKAAFVGWSCLPLLIGAAQLAGAWSGALVKLGQVGVAVGLALTVWSGVAYSFDWARAYARGAIR
jgi:CDP-diacylglycerol--glycerol-3-phosphate 3-phosphatidyltransferase